MPTVNELLYGMKTEGPQAKMAQLEGTALEVQGVSFFETDFGSGACVQCRKGDLPVWFVTFSSVVIDTLEKLKGKEPYTATFTSHTSGTGRTYWTME